MLIREKFHGFGPLLPDFGDCWQAGDVAPDQRIDRLKQHGPEGGASVLADTLKVVTCSPPNTENMIWLSPKIPWSSAYNTFTFPLSISRSVIVLGVDGHLGTVELHHDGLGCRRSTIQKSYETAMD